MAQLKLLVIGIDGATFDIIKPLISNGKLPNLKRLMDEGIHGNLRSTVPPMTAAAWTSFMTGMNPGQHGIFGFHKLNTLLPGQSLDLEYGGYVCAGKTFWEVINRRTNGRSAILFAPMTYPVWKINGVIVAGFPVPSTAKGYVYPPELYSEYKEYNLKLSEMYLYRKDKDAYIRLCSEMVQKRGSKISEKIEKGEYECIFGVFSAIDWMQHVYWRYREPELFKGTSDEEIARYGDAIDHHYEEIDGAVGRIMTKVNSETAVYIVSDHGFGHSPFYRFNTNFWLEKEGFLFPKRKSRLNKLIKEFLHKYEGRGFFSYILKLVSMMPMGVRRKARRFSQSLDIVDFARTRAFRVEMEIPNEGIVINLQGRQAEGSVRPEEYEGVRDEIIRRLVQVQDPRTGEKVIARVEKREEVYQGEKTIEAPDILVTMQQNYRGGWATDRLFSEVPAERLDDQSGNHMEYGILIGRGENIRKNSRIEGANIVDVAPTMLYGLGVPIPKYVKGKVLQEIFEESFRNKNPIRFEEEKKIAREEVEVEIGEKEKREIEEQLRGLGYME